MHESSASDEEETENSASSQSRTTERRINFADLSYEEEEKEEEVESVESEEDHDTVDNGENDDDEFANFMIVPLGEEHRPTLTEVPLYPVCIITHY